MPDQLTQVLRQHVDTLSHAPQEGFAGVRARARRRTQRRAAGAAAATAAVVVAGVLLGHAALSSKPDQPSHPVPTSTVPTPAAALAPATLEGTHWLFTSVTAQGHTLTLDDEQDYLVINASGSWVLREGCQTISGGASFGQQLQLVTQVKGSGACQAQPLPTAVTEVLHSTLTTALAGQSLTLSGATGSMTFKAEQTAATSASVTSRLWRLTQVDDATGRLDLSGYQTATPDGLWLVFSKGAWLGNDSCQEQQGAASFVGAALDLTLGPAGQSGDPCTAGSPHVRVGKAYADLTKGGRVSWTLTAGTLTLKGTTTTLTFRDAGPASALVS